MEEKFQKKIGAIRLGFRAFSIAIGTMVGLTVGGVGMYFVIIFLVAITIG